MRITKGKRGAEQPFSLHEKIPNDWIDSQVDLRPQIETVILRSDIW